MCNLGRLADLGEKTTNEQTKEEKETASEAARRREHVSSANCARKKFHPTRWTNSVDVASVSFPQNKLQMLSAESRFLRYRETSAGMRFLLHRSVSERRTAWAVGYGSPRGGISSVYTCLYGEEQWF